MSGLREFECVGRIGLGPVDPETRERLSRFRGEWLEYSPEERAVVVRHVQPGGLPAISAVPAELISLLDRLPAQSRDELAGGTLLLRDREGLLLRLVVDHDGIRVQWPREDWSHAVAVDVEEIFRIADPFSARVSGSLRFAGPSGAEQRLIDLIENFEGLYPEGDVRVDRDGGNVRAELFEVNVGPEELLGVLRAAADPVDSLEGDLRIGSFAPHAVERDFRVTLRAGEARAVRPALWPEG
jgi:hypothetical protein